MTHMLVLPLTCIDCLYLVNKQKCATQQDLDRHLFSNRGEAIFQCNYCPKSFIHRANYCQHTRSHLGQRSYKCLPCNKDFGLLGVFRKHQKFHRRKALKFVKNRVQQIKSSPEMRVMEGFDLAHLDLAALITKPLHCPRQEDTIVNYNGSENDPLGPLPLRLEGAQLCLSTGSKSGGMFLHEVHIREEALFGCQNGDWEEPSLWSVSSYPRPPWKTNSTKVVGTGRAEVGKICNNHISLHASDDWGTQMLQYATLFIPIIKYLKYSFVIEDQMLANMKQRFPNVTYQPLSSLGCSEFPYAYLKKGNLDLKFTQSRPNKKNNYTAALNYVYEKDWVDVLGFAKYKKELMYEFQLSKAHEDMINRDIVKVASRYVPPSEMVIYVGVSVIRHGVNRTEERLASDLYYKKALRIYRNRYGPHCVFFVVTDDLEWTKSTLGSYPNLQIVQKSSDKDIPKDFYDFLLLSLMNHTIQSHGNKGWFAAYLAQGDVIYPDVFFHPTTSIVHQLIKTGYGNLWEIILDPGVYKAPNASVFVPPSCANSKCHR
eukprot:maker-scaffold991_size72796-snap-gene-0.10 protein:Tk00556 transcript:maker-scaffold991_size72796-snap-gene-0.10-mRNA-1 annotation:"hypothetical protein CAPTEDRAFT_99760"